MAKRNKSGSDPGRLGTYFYAERWTLLIVAVTGIFYNVGMTAGPWFEGQLAQYLCDILQKKRQPAEMTQLALQYVAVLALVQALRYLKRLYVRKFANHTGLRMKQILYRNLLHRGKAELEQEGTGALMTKAISDVDACAEGMRKFTTEIFDTGVIMAAYLAMLLFYDWRLTLLAMLFPPAAYILAERLKVVVTRSAAAGRESAAALNGATLDRIANAVSYRVYGQEQNQNRIYERYLSDYERKSVRANIWENTMQPLYQAVSMTGVFFILWLGGKNVLGTGWAAWDIAAFSTFLSCFTKLAVKSSKAAKLFNSVQKAQVSWKRIRPYLQKTPEDREITAAKPSVLSVRGLSFCYPGGNEILKEISFEAHPGEIIGITGEVASGKSTLGKVFLCEYPYRGKIRFGGRELSQIQGDREHPEGVVGYLGHQPELFSGSIEENICLGKQGDVMPVLRAVCMDQEVLSFRDGIHTAIGSGGMRLSGGQQARIALARTLYHRMPVLVLDDPFSAVDQETERNILNHLRELTKDCIVLLISHRLARFPEFDRIIWLEDKRAKVSDHETLLQSCKAYETLYRIQMGQDAEVQSAAGAEKTGGGCSEA